MPFNFVLLDVEWHGRAISDAIRGTAEVLPDWAWPCWALGNHDETRIAERYGAVPLLILSQEAPTQAALLRENALGRTYTVLPLPAPASDVRRLAGALVQTGP